MYSVVYIEGELEVPDSLTKRSIANDEVFIV